MMTLYFRVSGRVQGVGFRYFTQRTARRFGLTGWVRNCFDGSVELEAQGPEESLKQLEDELRRGPSFGHVEHLEIRKKTTEEIYKIFDIVH
jgi:acylphosphatase